VKIARNLGLEERLKAEWIDSFTRPLPAVTLPAESIRDVNDHIHLSDLLNPRQSYFKRVMPMPPTAKDVQLWMYGRGFEVEVARRSSLRSGLSTVTNGISWRPDFTEWPGVFSGPIELKWRRANLAREGEEAQEYDNYLAQVGGYCSLGAGCHALLLVDTPRQGQSAANHLQETQPALHVLEVEFTEGELALRKKELLGLAKLFQAALDAAKKNPKKAAGFAQSLPLCADWLCGAPHVDNPGFCLECNKELVGQWAEKHTSTKVGAGHTVRPPTWKYDVRCPWYVFSRPELTDPSRGAR